MKTDDEAAKSVEMAADVFSDPKFEIMIKYF